MSFLLTYLRFHKQTITIVVLIASCLLLLAFLVPSFNPASLGITFLGDADAAVPAGLPDASPGSYNEPLVRPAEPMLQADSQLRGVTADVQPSAQYQEPLLTALNCAQELAGQPKLTHDPQLSDAAAEVWRELIRQPNTTLTELAAGKYAQVTILPLTLAEMPSDTRDVPDGQGEPSSSPCVMGGIDMAQLELRGVTAVGVAVFPDPHPEDGLDDSSAVILAQ